MKWRVLLVLCFAGLSLMANGELTKRQQKWLKDLDIAGVRTKKERDEDNRKKQYWLFQVETSQSPNEDNIENGFRIRIVVELIDKAKNTYLVDFTGNRPEMEYAIEYAGEDYWRMFLPFGKLDTPKINAYAIQYGFMDGETFVPFAEKIKARGVKTLDELVARIKTPFPETVTVKWYYVYDDQTEGTTDSISQNVRQIRTKTAEPVKTDSAAEKEKTDDSGEE